MFNLQAAKGYNTKAVYFKIACFGPTWPKGLQCVGGQYFNFQLYECISMYLVFCLISSIDIFNVRKKEEEKNFPYVTNVSFVPSHTSKKM